TEPFFYSFKEIHSILLAWTYQGPKRRRADMRRTRACWNSSSSGLPSAGCSVSLISPSSRCSGSALHAARGAYLRHLLLQNRSVRSIERINRRLQPPGAAVREPVRAGDSGDE